MTLVARNIVELFDQLRRGQYSKEEMALVRRAYQVAMALFSARFQSSGRVFLAHLVGTASLLVSLEQPTHLVAAGLLHNAYGRGDFGDGQRGPPDERRAVIRELVGPRVEELLARFAAHPWDPEQLRRCDREVQVLLVVEQLEKVPELPLTYPPEDPAREELQQKLQWMADLARELRLDTVAQGLERAFEGPEPPPAAVRQGASPYSRVIPSPSLELRP